MRPSNNEGSQLFKFHFPCNKGERGFYILSLESATSIQKPRNMLKVAYHSASCLLHPYTLYLCFKYLIFSSEQNLVHHVMQWSNIFNWLKF